MASPITRQHGTNTCYVKGCRRLECKRAHADYQLEYMGRAGNRAIESTKRQTVRNRLAQIKLALGCVDCGYNEHDVALDFDHRPGEVKLFSLSGGWGRAWSMVLLEIAKCDVVCANCHRVRTAARARKET